MRSITFCKILVGLTAGLFVGASSMGCSSDLAPISLPGGSHGGGSVASNGGNGGAIAGGGNIAGQSAIISPSSSAGSNGNVDAGPDGPPPIASVDANCGIQTQNPTVQAVDLLLVLDRSGSMDYDIATDVGCSDRNAPANCVARWSTLTTSLKQVLAASPASVHWGLKFFTSPGGGTCGVSAGVEVGVGPDTSAQIQTAIAGTSPENNTPTKAAIDAAVKYFKTVNDGLPHYILLATDGAPNCDPGTSGVTTTTSIDNAVAAIQAAAATGTDIKTYVVGIGPSANLTNLDAFATAGGTGNYYPANSPDGLTTAFSTIAGSVASCVFKMAEVPPVPDSLGVYLDHTTRVPPDQSEGYTLAADHVTVTLHGSYCDQLKDGTHQLVQVFFGCPGVPPPDQF